ncbi:unnamed protein product, partial [Ixodes pacificus]
MPPTPPTTRVVENLVYFMQRLQIPHCLCISFACADGSSSSPRLFETECTHAAVSAHSLHARPSAPFHRGEAFFSSRTASTLQFSASFNKGVIVPCTPPVFVHLISFGGRCVGVSLLPSVGLFHFIGSSLFFF